MSNLFAALCFYLAIRFEKLHNYWRDKIKIVRKVSITQMTLKEGDQYRCGEAIVTLAKFGIEGKQEVAKKILAAEARVAARKQALTERGESIMLMSPEELKQFQVDEWLSNRKIFKDEKKKRTS